MSGDSIKVSTGVLLTITTGAYLVDSFSEFHDAADVVMGQPLFTHQFASDAVADQMKREVHRQHPWTVGVHFPSYECENQPDDEARKRFCQEWVAEQSARHGERHTLVSPPETRHVSLLEGLPAKFGGSR